MKVRRLTDNIGVGEHGLRFTNDEWNNTIINGNVFVLRWNQTVDAPKAMLGLFKVNYPSEGVMVLETVADMTYCLEPTYCKWKAESLGADLYSFWLANNTTPNAASVISPPWMAKQPKQTSFTWAAPFLVPICLLLFLYFVCVTTCLMYRKKRRAKRQGEEAARARDQQQHQRRRHFTLGSEPVAEEGHIVWPRRVNHHGSFDSRMTVEVIESPEVVLIRQSMWLASSQSLPAAGSEIIVVAAASNKSSQTDEWRAAYEQVLAELAVQFVQTQR